MLQRTNKKNPHLIMGRTNT